MPVTLLVLLYAVLLIHPIPLPFISTQVRNLVIASMPPNNDIELGDMALALEGYAWPVIKFSPVTYKDTATGARVRMDAFEVGFSPVRALIGQPGATVTMVGPHIQLNQDLFGPRLAQLEVIPDPEGGPAIVRVLEGSAAFPAAGFEADGINVRGETTEATHVRSDNDWLVFNLEAAQASIASVIEQAEMGRFSRLVIKDATADMNDALYGSLRTFTDISLDIAPTPDGRAVEGNFSANFGGTVMQGIFERVIDEEGKARLKISLNNFDLAAFAPLINDEASMGGIAGPAAVSLDIGFNAETGRIEEGVFHADMTGTEFRLGEQYFPIASNIMEIDWDPATGTFTMAESTMSIGETTTRMSGVFILGLDELYGPTVGISMSGRDVTLNEAGTPAKLFDTVSFQGWSAPIYGAVGIDQVVLARDDGTRLESRGRIDMLRKGVGFDMTVVGRGFNAADIRRVWPPTIVPEARAWFENHVLSGEIESTTMKLAFPVGTLEEAQKTMVLPQNSLSVDMVIGGISIGAVDGATPVEIGGKTRVQVRDTDVTVVADGGRMVTEQGELNVSNASLIISSDAPGENIVEVSGDLSGGIPAIVALAKQVQPDLLGSDSMPLDLGTLQGDLAVQLVSTTFLDAAGATKKMDYTISGNLKDFGTAEPVEGYQLGNGQLAFVATQAGFRVGGSAELQGMKADLDIAGDLTSGAAMPPMRISAAIDLADLSKLGVDVGDFGTGRVAVTAEPQQDGSIAIAADLKDANLDIADLGIRKAAGQAGSVKAVVRPQGDVTDVTGLDLAFGTVRLRGGMQLGKAGLKSAEFTSFALSEGDAAQVSMTPINDGFAVRIRGDQLDLKPVLGRFFSLESGSGGPQATSVDQTIALDVELKRALGMYKTNAYNLSLDLALRGSDIRRLTMQAQVGNGGQVSVATNPTDQGRTMTVVFNDLGSLLRLVGVYPQLQGGEGTFVLAQNSETKVDNGTVTLRNFAIVDEANVAALLEGHPDSRRLLRSSNTLAFETAKADFVRRVDRIQIVEAVLTGDGMGGSGEGFIYTDKKQYDLVGTVIPAFGINNAFGRLLGGGNNGGMFGITFAVRGPLDQPKFQVNPLSALAPGAFRSLFEFRAREQPRVD